MTVVGEGNVPVESSSATGSGDATTVFTGLAEEKEGVPTKTSEDLRVESLELTSDSSALPDSTSTSDPLPALSSAAATTTTATLPAASSEATSSDLVSR